MAVLPLFPLGTVLVPGMLLTLNVFEPRYRHLLRDLSDLEPDRRCFGVVAIKAGHEVGVGAVQAMHEVGTVALIRNARSLGGGAFLIVALGTDRFRLLEVLDDDATPYARGRVELLAEPEDAPDPGLDALADSLSAGFCALLDTSDVALPELPTEPRELSYFVAANAPVSLQQRQRLLEVDGTAPRLRAALDLVHGERRLRSRFGTTPHQGPLPPAGVN